MKADNGANGVAMTELGTSAVPAEEDELGCSGRMRQFVKVYWKSLFVLLVPTLTALIFLVDTSPAFRCLYVVIVMSFLWVTEALPLPITSMLPIVLFPLLGILSTGQTCMVYMKEPAIMFIGGIVLALAIEYCNLHKRVALKVIALIGCSQRRLHFGLIIVTMFMSMWISNTAAVAMMCPIVQAVLQELESQGLCQMYESTGSVEGADDGKQKEEYTDSVRICDADLTSEFFRSQKEETFANNIVLLFGDGLCVEHWRMRHHCGVGDESHLQGYLREPVPERARDRLSRFYVLQRAADGSEHAARLGVSAMALYGIVQPPVQGNENWRRK
uniref:Protein I'm not dead yet n=1 Tax=Culex pipiens TaxID=7175 RepID=A0A8D8GYI1_CULPI